MRVLVTGGAGFIGSHTVEHLVASGHDVVVLDDLSSGRRENLAEVEVPLFIGDIRDRAAVARAIEGADAVIHLAAFISVPGSVSDPVTSSEVNVVGTAIVLEAARASGVGRLVLASSAAVYGDTETVPTPEDVPLQPMSPYGVQKLAGEQLCRLTAHGGGPDTVSFRFFNVYGPRQSPDSDYAAVIPIFRDRCARGRPPTIFGDGTQTRDFVHVSDVAEGLRRAITAETPFRGAVFNLARGEGTTIGELARVIARTQGAAVEAETAPPRAGDIEHSVADIAGLRRAFGWAPGTGLEAGLRW